MTASSKAQSWVLAEVIGAPVSHSRSPLIHNQWIRALNLNASFAATHVEPHELGEWLKMRRTGSTWRGCSVTAPLKQLIVPHLDGLSKEARRLGAVNLVQHRNGKLIGYNTDVDGVRSALTPHLQSRGKLAILGAGGAMRAALQYALDDGFHDVRIVTRSPGRTFNKLACRFPDRFSVIACEHAEQAMIDACAVINATPLGSSYGAAMRSDVLDSIKLTRGDAAIFDMVYDPVDTELLRMAARTGRKTIGGLDMLVGQARRAFTLLFKRQPPSALKLDLQPISALFEPRSAENDDGIYGKAHAARL